MNRLADRQVPLFTGGGCYVRKPLVRQLGLSCLAAVVSLASCSACMSSADQNEWPSQQAIAASVHEERSDSDQSCERVGSLPNYTGQVLDLDVAWFAFGPGERLIPIQTDAGSNTSERSFGPAFLTLEGDELDATAWPEKLASTATPNSVWLFRPGLTDAQAELDRGAELRVGVTRPEAMRSLKMPTALYFITMRPDGSMFMVGSCPGSALQTWASTGAQALQLTSPAEMVKLVVDAEDPADAFARYAAFAPATTTTPP